MSTLIDGANLIAPLDVIRFALAYLALIVAPGYAVAALARPGTSRLERLAFALPCAYGLVAVCGLATALLRVTFDPVAYGVLALPVTAFGARALWRERGAPPASRERARTRSRERWWLVLGVVALVQAVVIALVYAGAAVPSGSDVVYHTTWTTLIARAHVYPIALMSSHIGANDGGFYPPVFHAVTALVLTLAPMAVYRAVFYSVVAAILLLPVALFAYVRTVTGSARLGGLAALASLAFESLPYFVLSQGLYPFTVSLLIAPMLALALYHALGYGDRRAVVLAALVGVGLFYTHPTEFVTATLLALGIVPGLLRRWQAWARAAGYGLAVCAAWLVAALPALAAVHTTMVTGAQSEINTTHDFAPAAQVDLPGVLNGYLHWVYGYNVSYLLLGAVLLGALWCVKQRRWRGLVAIQVLLFILFVDANSYNVLHRFYVLSFPWALWERLAATHYWFALPLAAIGLDAAGRYAWHFLRAKATLYVALAASPAMLLGLLLPLDVSAGRAAAYAGARRVVAPADIVAIAWLARHAAGAAIVNDADLSGGGTFDVPSDAGLWMPALGVPDPLFQRSGAGPGSLDDRFYVLRHIADRELPPRAGRYIDLNNVRYVFYGAAIRPGATRHLNLARLLSDPRLRLAYASAATCRGVAYTAATCPATGSYIFTLDRTQLAYSR